MPPGDVYKLLYVRRNDSESPRFQTLLRKFPSLVTVDEATASPSGT